MNTSVVLLFPVEGNSTLLGFGCHCAYNVSVPVSGNVYAVSYTHLTLPTNREV